MSQQFGPPQLYGCCEDIFSDSCEFLKKMAGDEENDPVKDVLKKKVRIREGHRQYARQLLAQIEDGKDDPAVSSHEDSVKGKTEETGNFR